MELNRDQIIKALEYCTNYAPLRCDECPMEAPPMTFKGSLSCSDKLMEIALALITSQEQKIKELTEDNEDLNKTISNLLETIKDIKTDTARKMQEIIATKCAVHKMYYVPNKEPTIIYELTNWELDQIVKEMLEIKCE